MASTRNNNMPGEYCLQQKSYNQGSAYLLNKSKRVASHSTIPCPGVNHGQVPNTVLAYNATDIESSLFGINSSNLVDNLYQLHEGNCTDRILHRGIHL